MSAVSNPSDNPRPARARTRAARLASAGLVALALAGLSVVAPAAGPADAATTPELVIKWDGDTSAAAPYQPDRLPGAHFNEFKGITLSVSQTTGLLDQAIRVSVAGFAGTRSYFREGVEATNAMNYLQAMQCWGDPDDPDFRETCQWGGRAFTDGNGLGNTVISDNAMRVGPLDRDPSSPTAHDVPFRTVDGQTISGKPRLVNNKLQYDILQFFGPATTNEITSARVGSDGTGYFDFETQSSIQAPQLGCGTASHLRCWLVVVPRGTVFGGDGEQCSGILDPANGFDPYTKGRPGSVQGGSPINDLCDYWDNRIVVPLDFAPTGKTCDVASAETRVIGSQLMVSAMTSWQPSLCQSVKATFVFSTNPDSVARAQVLATGANSPTIAYSGYPVSSAELATVDERTLLSKTQFRYAPVAVSSVVIGFLAEPSNGRIDQLNLSPRLMAKLLTQSYKFTVPSNSSDPARNFAHLPAANRQYNYLNQDPEFQALNPTNYSQFTGNPAILLPGPSGADAIKQVWRWILADQKAVDFLNGAVEPLSGMSVNPYYLPKVSPAPTVGWDADDRDTVIPTFLDSGRNDLGSTPESKIVGLTNLDGTPKKLAETVLDSFPKNDESLVPLQLTLEKSRFDTIQFAPYTENLLSGARQAFRANPNSKTVWDATKLNSAGEAGDWVSSGTQLPGDKFMITITDSPSAARYSLSTAGLQVPNGTAIVHADTIGMTNALAGLQPTTTDGVKQVDPTYVPDDGYPMTMVTYAAVNVTKATATQRATIGAMLKQVTTEGQVPGTALGQLPPGYLPLPEEMKAQASTAATAIQSYVAPATTPTKTTTSYAQDGYDAGAGAANSGVGATDPTLTSGADSLSEDRTPVSATEPIVRNGLVIALGVGLAGFLIAPILFRGRGFL